MGQKAKRRGASSGVRGVPKGSGHMTETETEKTVHVPPSTRLPLSIVVFIGLAVLLALLYPQISGPASNRIAKSEPEQLESDTESGTRQDTTHLKNDETDDKPVLKQNDPMIDEDTEILDNAEQTVSLTREGNGKIHFTKETEQSNEKRQDNPSKENGSSSQGTTKSKTKSTNKNKKKSKSLKKEASSNSPSSPTSTSADEKELPKEVRDFKPTFQKTMKPKKIFADGRRLPPIELLPQKPNNSSVKVFLYDEFLSEAECDGLMKVHDSHVAQANKHDPFVCFDSINTLRQHLKANKVKVKVTPQDFMPGTLCVNATFSTQLKSWFHSNWSYSTAFYPGESRFSKVFEYRVKEATGLLPENGGKFQLTSYPLGIGYKTHTDCIENSKDQRDRMATILVYLQDVEEGGETMFPEPTECYRDTTRLLCDWFYDRPSTSSQADQYATTSPQQALSSERTYREPDMADTPNTVYPDSDQFWNDRFKQLKSRSSLSYTTFPYKVNSAGPLSRPRLLPWRQIWSGGMTSPFQTAFRKLHAVSCTDVDVSTDEGSSVDPCFTPQDKTGDESGSMVDPISYLRPIDNCTGLD